LELVFGAAGTVVVEVVVVVVDVTVAVAVAVFMAVGVDVTMEDDAFGTEIDVEGHPDDEDAMTEVAAGAIGCDMGMDPVPII